MTILMQDKGSTSQEEKKDKMSPQEALKSLGSVIAIYARVPKGTNPGSEFVMIGPNDYATKAVAAKVTAAYSVLIEAEIAGDPTVRAFWQKDKWVSRGIKSFVEREREVGSNQTVVVWDVSQQSVAKETISNLSSRTRIFWGT